MGKFFSNSILLTRPGRKKEGSQNPSKSVLSARLSFNVFMTTVAGPEVVKRLAGVRSPRRTAWHSSIPAERSARRIQSAWGFSSWEELVSLSMISMLQRLPKGKTALVTLTVASRRSLT
jgi:hypothetical protein